MQLLNKQTCSEILKLKSNALISDAIAERQTEVIRKGFNYLFQKGKNALYIADEVGLGKTYIALGIASLLRHFSSAPDTYQDVIVVPKENLQYKWQKEIRQFVYRNYLPKDNRVKSVIGTPVATTFIKERLEAIQHDYPAYHIYRNSSFSFGFSADDASRKNQYDELCKRLTNDKAKSILYAAWKAGYFNANKKPHLKKLYAYLLSLCNPSIELLIIDEGHNYKKGLGVGDDDWEVSDRNNVIARFWGIKKNTENDREIFQDFPQLRYLVKPKVEKLIVLSATPKTESLLELKRQLDCFLPTHILSEAKTEEDIKALLPQFLIRGNMEYEVGGKNYTRNLCRLEHRKGNVEKVLTPEPLTLRDNEQAIVLGLMQYSTIKHLDAKHNATFELGMLAGFETFRIDQEKRAQNKVLENGNAKSGDATAEYEEVRTRRTKSSQDYAVLKNILSSYKGAFGTLPPHPKQDAIVDAAFKMMKEGEKSLVFVRRVASAAELKRRLLDKWEGMVAEEIEKKWIRRMGSKELSELLSCYRECESNRELAENVDSIFNRMIERFNNAKGQYDFSEERLKAEEKFGKALHAGLYYLYNNYKDVEGGEQWYELLSRHSTLANIKTELLDSSYELLVEHKDKWSRIGEGHSEEEGEDVEEAYFFHSYFLRPNAKPFKLRLYNTDWFDVNYFLLNEHFKIAHFQALPLTKQNIHSNDRNDIREVQEIFLKYVEEDDYIEQELDNNEYPAVLVEKSTLITRLLIDACEREFNCFLQRLKGKKKAEIFAEIKTLLTIIKACIRNGSGFLPLFIADKARGEMTKNYLSLIGDETSVFSYVLLELKGIINDYELLRAVNFPDGESHKQIESKLRNQTPVLGLTGQSLHSKSNVAAQFRMPGFPYVLITTDIFREGEDLHTYCQNIYHYGIAWNCSDMEQRTGRIDRINSVSHRKMMYGGAVDFDNRIHVFYPYLQQTLEVNQVTRLFRSINSFVETFNDFTKNVREEGVASVKEGVVEVLPVIEEPLHSRYEYMYFKGCSESGKALRVAECIGDREEGIKEVLMDILTGLQNSGSEYYYGPAIELSSSEIKGDINILSRKKRRGPFVVRVKNDVYPGKFLIEAASHLYKATTKIQRATNELVAVYADKYKLINVDEFYAISFCMRVDDYKRGKLIQGLLDLVRIADEIEDRLTKGKDEVVYG